MKRREFITLVGGAAAAAPVAYVKAARAQASRPVVGFLGSGSPGANQHTVAGFRRGLAENGFAEGRIAVEYRWAESRMDRLPALASDLVRTHVAAICAGGPPAALAAKGATATVPIVFTSGEDPVKIGLVASYNRPGANVTGVAVLIDVLGAKRLGLLRELVPSATSIAVLLNPNEPTFDTQSNDVQEAAQAAGIQIHILRASTEREIEAAFEKTKELRANAMLVGVAFLYTSQREQFATLAARHALPTIYGQREFATAGGLMSYGTNLADAYYQAGVYTSRILKGSHPADMPVVQSSKFELLINLKAAKALGLNFPIAIQQLADEVVE